MAATGNKVHQSENDSSSHLNNAGILATVSPLHHGFAKTSAVTRSLPADRERSSALPEVARYVLGRCLIAYGQGTGQVVLLVELGTVSYTHLTLPTTPYV